LIGGKNRERLEQMNRHECNDHIAVSYECDFPGYGTIFCPSQHFPPSGPDITIVLKVQKCHVIEVHNKLAEAKF